jgi:hypothetical protein
VLARCCYLSNSIETANKITMKQSKIITIVLLFFTFSISAQTVSEKKEIYQTVIKTFADNNLPLINETFTRIYNYDIDGNLDKWFYQEQEQKSDDSSEIIINTICVIPIEYSQSIESFLKSQNMENIDFSNRINNLKLDSLNKYILDNRIISWKKAPISNSTFRNIFKKKQTIGLSSILFDRQNNLALVKI